MNGPVDLWLEHEACIRAILHAHVPDARVVVFGSRAKRTARPYSDLDLAIDAGDPLAATSLSALAEAFEESDLPMRVDVVDLQSVDPGFRTMIERTRVELVQRRRSGDEGGASECTR